MDAPQLQTNDPVQQPWSSSGGDLAPGQPSVRPLIPYQNGAGATASVALVERSEPLAAIPLPLGAGGKTGYEAAKRALDLAVSLIGLVIALPVMLLVGLIVRLDSPGPVIFRQTRVGKDGRPFTFYKFRTMYADARERFPELYSYQYTDEEVQTMYFKVLHDPRLTRFGRHVRKTSLDELPNLINVLRGDMTLVGPRPELPEMLPYYTPEQLVKFSVKPGVTGLAQVTGRSVLRFQQTIAADVEYVRRRSFWFDIAILVRTVRTVLLRVGAF